MVQGTIEQLKTVLTAAISPELSPRMAIDGDEIAEVMFSNKQRERYADRAARGAAAAGRDALEADAGEVPLWP